MKLPKLTGDYAGISQINKFFEAKEKSFYEEITNEFLEPLDMRRKDNPSAEIIEGLRSNWGRVADYELESIFEEVISVSAWLNGGMGGVNWLGKEGDTFDLNSGKRLELSDIFKISEEQYMDIIYDYVSREIAGIIEASKEGMESYWFNDPYSGEGYETIRRFNPDDFYLAEKSLVVFYPKYTFASGAAGLSLNIFEIPYDDIRDVLAIDIS